MENSIKKCHMSHFHLFDSIEMTIFHRLLGLTGVWHWNSTVCYLVWRGHEHLCNQGPWQSPLGGNQICTLLWRGWCCLSGINGFAGYLGPSLNLAGLLQCRVSWVRDGLAKTIWNKTVKYLKSCVTEWLTCLLSVSCPFASFLENFEIWFLNICRIVHEICQGATVSSTTWHLIIWKWSKMP